MSERLPIFRPMIGHILLFAILVDGPPGSSAEFTPDEQARALAEVYHAAGILRGLAQKWGAEQPVPVRDICNFTVASKTVQIFRDPDPLAAAPDENFELRDAIWLPDAFAALGMPFGSTEERSRLLRKGLIAKTFLGLGVADAVPIIISKYPVHHLAYALEAVVFGLSEVTTSVATDDKLRKNHDGVLAHEIGHTFGAPDEYGFSLTGVEMCRTTEHAGFFSTTNDNCEIIQPGQPNPDLVPCLMRLNNHVVCPSTPLHWGWVDADNDGQLDLALPATVTAVGSQAFPTPGVIEFVPHLAHPVQQVVINGRNVWDARAIAFGDTVVSAPSPPTGVDSITVNAPQIDGIVTVSVLTRAGLSTGAVDDTWLLVTPQFPPTGIDPAPAVFGMVPRSGPPGTRVRIVGTRLTTAESITFGGVEADLSQGEPGNETYEVDVPAGPVGTVPVVVRTPNGTSEPFAGFAEFTVT